MDKAIVVIKKIFLPFVLAIMGSLLIIWLTDTLMPILSKPLIP